MGSRSQRRLRAREGFSSSGDTHYPGSDYVFDWPGTWPSGSGTPSPSTFDYNLSEDIGNYDIDLDSLPPAPVGLTSYAITPAYPGASIVTGDTLRLDTDTIASGQIIVERTDDTGVTELRFNLTMVTYSLSTSGIVTFGSDDPGTTVYSGTFTGGEYNAEPWSFTKDEITGLADGAGHVAVVPAEPKLTTDTGTPGELDPGDVASRGRAGIWAYEAGATAPTVDASLRDQSGELEADFEANDYTGTGTEDTSIFTRETDSFTTADSPTVPVAGAPSFTPPDLGVKLVAGWNASTSSLWQDQGTRAIAATGDTDPVEVIEDESSNNNDIELNGSPATLGVSGGIKWINWADARFSMIAQLSEVQTDMEVFAAIRTSDLQWPYAGTRSNSDWLVTSSQGSTGTMTSNAGSPVIWTNGVQESPQPTDQGELYTAWTTGADIVAHVTAADLATNARWQGPPANNNFQPLAYGTTDANDFNNYTGRVYAFYITRALTTQERSDMVTYLQGLYT